MPSLIAQDTSGVFVQGPQEVEVPELRTRSFRKFRLPDAPDGRKRWRVGGGVGPVHYRTDPYDDGEQFKEIDLDILPTPGEPWDAACETNGFQVRFWQARTVGAKTVRYIAQFRRAGAWFAMAPLALVWRNTAGQVQLIKRTVGGIVPTIDNEAHTVTWAGAFGPGLDFRYSMGPDTFVKQAIIQSKASLPAPTIGLAGLKLVLVMTVAWGGAHPANGFAPAVEDGDVSGDDDLTVTVDEELADPSRFAHLRADLREAFWCHAPRAWDSAAEPHEVAVQWRLQRRGSQVLALFGVAASALNNAATVYPVIIDTVMAEEQVGASTDDARNRSNASWPGNANFSATVATGETSTGTAYWNIIGAIFRTVPIPNSATIDSSSISVMSHSDYTNDYNPIIGIHAQDNVPMAFTAGDPPAGYEPYDVMQGSTAGVTWANGTAAWTATNFYPSADISSELQPVVNRAGWATGQDIAVVIWGPNVAVGDYARTIRLWDTTGNVSGPKFNCTYTEAATGRALFLGPNLWTGGKQLLKVTNL